MNAAPLGIIMLVHGDLRRPLQTAQYWARQGVPLVIHADLATPADQVAKMRAGLSEFERVHLIQTRRCKWGSWDIVAASLDAAEVMLDMAPDLSHVMLTSGTCLPIKPAPALFGHLAAHPKSDFIDSQRVGPNPAWVQGGLELERFSLYFPRWALGKQRLFDRLVELQRLLKVNRPLPTGLQPHIGQQWRCLSTKTLRAILSDPTRSSYERFFKRAWISDESYFQTLVRKHGCHILPSLTLSEFDINGRPFMIYDDHLMNLKADPHFIVRKICPSSARLYNEFLSDDAPRGLTSVQPIGALMRQARSATLKGRKGLVTQSRFFSPKRDGLDLARPVFGFFGFEDATPDFFRMGARVFANHHAWQIICARSNCLSPTDGTKG